MERWLSLLFLSASLYCNAQVFWTEAFGSAACSSGALASAYSGTNGAWAVSNTGVNNSSANTWFVSAKERGMGAGACGAGCGGTNNKTLHLGSTGSFLTDLGAAYNASGAGNITDRRAESPAINCSGKSNITLSFNYMEWGEGTNDNGTLWYFDGTSWSQLVDIPKSLCCGPTTCNGSLQGLWTNYTLTLPASANNNTGVKVGFRWVNDGNGSGQDPSFAVDDVRLSVSAILPIELKNFYYEKDDEGRVWLHWITVSEKNADYFEVERSFDGYSYYSLGTVKAANNLYKEMAYKFYDTDILDSKVYYRLKMVDRDESFQYAGPLVTSDGHLFSENSGYFVNESHLELEEFLINPYNVNTVIIYNIEGKKEFCFPVKELEKSNGRARIPLTELPAGIYVCQLEGYSYRKNFKFLLVR
jgi:hypothetical protein